jgi:hypothetical protein
VYTVNNQPFYNEGVSGYYDSAGALTMFSSRRGDNKIPCELTSSASEFPVLWFKDGLLVETKDTCMYIWLYDLFERRKKTT